MDQIGLEMEWLDKCPLCGGEGHYEIQAKEPKFGTLLTIYYCDDCGLTYHNPRFLPEDMRRYYTSGAYREHSELEVSGEKERANRLLNLIESNSDTKATRFLDFGCSRGYLAKGMQERFGSEIVSHDIFVSPEHVVDIVTDINDISGKFDLIACIHVLEHLYNPIETLLWMMEHLEEGGKILLEIPTLRKILIAHPMLYEKKTIEYIMVRIGATCQYREMPTRHIALILVEPR
jgi:2-polyprenyl-3-methyl-5-hydroxy-6-metoxy-1,4-benzoquinol methylase